MMMMMTTTTTMIIMVVGQEKQPFATTLNEGDFFQAHATNFVLGLAPSQQLQYSNNRIAALLDCLFMTSTMAAFVLRHLGWSGVMLALGVLLCPPVALPLFLSKMSASQKLK
jgi:hypothetical protein